jgi:uncharacterized membrane protein YeaQ/YmgE (transglycosylase-associated protein family)
MPYGSDLCAPAEGTSMRSRGSTWLLIFIGSTIGGFIPEMWGADLFSYSSLLFSGVGAFVGLWFGTMG